MPARAFRSALPRATRSAATVRSSTSSSIDVAQPATRGPRPEATPRLRITRRCGERDGERRALRSQARRRTASRSRAADSAVGAMHHVLADLDREVAANRAGAASSGFVAPITWRAALTASWPSSTIATSGPEVMNRQARRRTACRRARRSAAWRSLVELHLLQRHDPQALALEAGDDLAGQAARERVRLDQDQGPVHLAVPPSFRVQSKRLGRVSSGAGGSAQRRLRRPRPATPGRRRAAAGAAAAARIAPRDLGLAVGADRPVRLERRLHSRARLLELAQALGQRRKSFSIAESQLRADAAPRAGRSRFGGACISSSRSRTSSRYSGGLTIV